MKIDKTLKTCGIYIMYFEKDDYMYYIGKSLHVWDRYVDHLNLLDTGKHHNYKLVQDYRKFKEYPSIFLLEECNPEELASKEIYWIDVFDSYRYGYNLTYGGEGAGFGEGSSSAKYTNEDYEAIFYLLSLGDWSYIDISEELGIEISIVNSIAIGSSHKYLHSRFPDMWSKIQFLHLKRACKHDSNTYLDIFLELVNTSTKLNVLAKKYNISQTIVEEISAGTTHNYLKTQYPEEWSILMSKKGKRRSGSQSGEPYPSVVSPDGVVYSNIENAKQFALEHNLHQGHFGDLLRSKCKSHKGWKILQ